MSAVLASRADVARLFGRAAFGATGADLDRWTGAPYEDVVGALFPPGPPSARPPAADDARRTQLESATNDLNAAGRWWLERMRTGAWPLEERMTLFWHDHFATAYAGRPDVGNLMIQNRTLREHALGDFRALTDAMTADPAMLYWLNGTANRHGGVNENYAREFLELFTLGTTPQVYGEGDVREAARVFTGFGVNTNSRAATFTPNRHDPGQKVVLGRTIGPHPRNSVQEANEYREATLAVLEHDEGRTASRFVAGKLVRAFGYLPGADLAADPLVEAVAAALRPSWSIEAAVRTMLLHEGWRDAPPVEGKQLVRSPIELVVHATKVLGVTCDPPGGVTNTTAYTNNIPLLMARRMGQGPFQPPNVGGWPADELWLSQTANLARYDAMNHLLTHWRNQNAHVATPLPPSGDLAAWARFFGVAGYSTNTTLRLQDYLAVPGTTAEATKQNSVFILVGASPDWQVM